MKNANPALYRTYFPERNGSKKQVGKTVRGTEGNAEAATGLFPCKNPTCPPNTTTNCDGSYPKLLRHRKLSDATILREHLIGSR